MYCKRTKGYDNKDNMKTAVIYLLSTNNIFKTVLENYVSNPLYEMPTMIGGNVDEEVYSIYHAIKMLLGMESGLYEEDLFDNEVLSDISIIGMLKGENKFTYPNYTQIQASELISELREIVDFVIVDCSSHLSDDILSTVALIESDCVLRLINCDLKSVSYLSSQLPLLADSKFKADKQLKVANDVKSIHANENIEQVIGGVTFTIPHSDLVEKQYLSGELLLDTPPKRETKEFRQVIGDIAEEVFDL